MDDLISRQAAIDALNKHSVMFEFHLPHEFHEVKEEIRGLPSAQPTQTNAPNALKSLDCISRQAAIEAIYEMHIDGEKGVIKALPNTYGADLREIVERIEELPPAQPEPLSDAYTKAVWTWLLDYQIKAAELKGRYTPYEVLSWVANDWRKEHEGSD